MMKQRKVFLWCSSIKIARILIRWATVPLVYFYQDCSYIDTLNNCSFGALPLRLLVYWYVEQLFLWCTSIKIARILICWTTVPLVYFYQDCSYIDTLNNCSFGVLLSRLLVYWYVEQLFLWCFSIKIARILIRWTTVPLVYFYQDCSYIDTLNNCSFGVLLSRLLVYWYVEQLFFWCTSIKIARILICWTTVLLVLFH